MNDQFDYNRFNDMSCGNFFKYLLTLSSNELALLAVGLGFLFSANIDANAKNSLGNFFELIGQVLLTISAQEIELQPSSPSRVELQAQIIELKKEIDKIKKANL